MWRNYKCVLITSPIALLFDKNTSLVVAGEVFFDICPRMSRVIALLILPLDQRETIE